MERKLKTIASIVLALLLVAMGVLIWWVYGQPDKATEYDLINGDMSGNVAITMTSGDGWENSDKTTVALYGTQYDGELFNLTGNVMRDWTISFSVPEQSIIDSCWNGVYTPGAGEIITDGQISLSFVDYNEKLLAGTSQPFGFILYTPGPIEITDFHLSIISVRSLFNEPLFWILAVAIFTMMVIMVTSTIVSVKYRHYREKMDIYHDVSEQAMKTFAKTIDAKDEYTSGHSSRVALYSRELAARIGLSADEQERIYYIALLHDIGKIAVPDSILTKPGALTEEEREQIKKHTAAGGDILAAFSAIEGISDGARFHHERYDGLGYMAGLKGEEIPLCARIIGVADAFDAMSSARCYRPALSREKILSELEAGTGKQFDPAIVCHMIDMIKEGKTSL